MSAQEHIGARELRRRVAGSLAAHQSLVHACLTWCRVHRVPVCPIETSGKVVKRNGKLELWKNPDQRGISDIIACLDGRAVLIECKTGGAHRSTVQIQRQKEWSNSGALCLVIRSVDELERAITRARAALA